jgi:hypothetical protein
MRRVGGVNPNASGGPANSNTGLGDVAMKRLGSGGGGGGGGINTFTEYQARYTDVLKLHVLHHRCR